MVVRVARCAAVLPPPVVSSGPGKAMMVCRVACSVGEFTVTCTVTSISYLPLEK